MLPHPTLEDDYALAWKEWSTAGENEAWETATGDGLAVTSKAQAEQIKSIAAERLLHRLGRVSSDELTAIEEALRLHPEL
jgi:hypothetical protein